MKFAAVRASDEFVRAPNFLYFVFKKNLYSGGLALGFEHAQNILRGTVAEKLAECFLVIGNMVFFHERNEFVGFVAGQSGFREVRIRGIEIFRPAMQVREVAAASAGDQDFFARATGAFEDRDAPAALAGLDRAHQSGRSRAQNYRIEFVDHNWIVCKARAAANDYGILSLSLDRSRHRRVHPRIPIICYNADRFCRLDFRRVVGDSTR
jgi:hypothetical protein